MGIPSGRGGALALCLAACSSGTAPRYRTAEVVERDLVATIESTGRLRAQGRRDLPAPISGLVTELSVAPGDRVEAGAVLLALSSEEGAQALNQARAEASAAEGRLRRVQVQLAQARRSLDRTQALFEQGQRSAQVLEAVRAEVASAEANTGILTAEREAARAHLEAAQDGSRAALRAPGPGVVLRVDVESGQRVQAGGPPIVVLSADLATLHLAATVSESDVGRVEAGGRVRFEVPAFPEERFLGVVRNVGLLGSEEQGVVAYQVEVEADNPEGRLRPGMSAAVWFEVARADGALVVPEAALRFRPLGVEIEEEARRSEVFVIVEGELRSVPVVGGLSDGAWVAVKGGLKAGDEVVLGVENESASKEGGLSLGGRR
ncbi:MAG: efflux RND transporter periplasmic adaptor subunit [Myxococcota bacterium]